jgi:hypothetical protein
MDSQNNSPTKNLNEESSQLSGKQPEQSCSQEQNAVTLTNLNNEKSTCKNVSEQHDIEKNNLKSQKRQTTMTEFANQANKTQQQNEGTTNKRKNESFELLSAPSKKRQSASRKQQFDFSKTKTKLFDDKPSNDMDVQEVTKEPFVFCGENSKSTQKYPKQNSTQAPEVSSKTTPQYPKHKPPPIVISSGSAAEIRRCTNEVNNQPRSFLIDIKKDKQGTKTVTTENWNDYEKLIAVLKDKKHRFHTYSTEEPQMKFVVYGLPAMELEELEKGFKAEKVSPVKIVKMTMKQKRHNDDQNYLLYFKGGNQEGDQANLMKILKNIKYVDGFKVKWAKYKNKHSGPSQCSKCLQFGHGQRGCNKQPICFRCSEQHDSKECPHKLIENNKVPLEKLKCHFCGEKHTAISLACKTRMQIIEKWKAKSMNGNNRNQNKTAGHHSKDQTGQQRNIPLTQKKFEQSNKSAYTLQRQQNRNNEPKPSTSRAPFPVNQNPAPVKPKQQNTLPTHKPVVQQNSWNSQRKKQRKNRNKKFKQNNNNQRQKQTRPEPDQTVEVMEISTPSTSNEVLSEHKSSVNTEKQTASTDVPAQGTSTSSQSDTESPTSRCILLLNELFKIIAQNPECMKYVEQAIGSVAKNTTSKHGS